MFMPKTASIAPSPAGTASCIAFPLSRSKYNASSKLRDSAHTNALYSPKEWPAKNLTLSVLNPNSSVNNL